MVDTPSARSAAGDSQSISLRVAGSAVAEYVIGPELDPTLSPRPYLHPVRTLGGTVVTDALPADHRWHLGAGLAVPDVAGTNLWGGRSYVRGQGYTWLDDHGRIRPDELGHRAADQLAHRLRWCDPAGATLLTEHRQLRARPVIDHPEAWALEFSYTLTAPADRDVTLGSPATNGRPGGAGYGGFFWRLAPSAEPPRVFSAGEVGEERVNGSAAEWVAMTVAGPRPYTLVFSGLGEGDRWFVRAAQYPGVCVAFAFETTVTIPAGSSRTGAHTVVIADGATALPADQGESADFMRGFALYAGGTSP